MRLFIFYHHLYGRTVELLIFYHGGTVETVNWFESYLSDRRQRVKVNGLKSSLMPVKQGVPQESIVGPILFVLFINDLPQHVTNSDVDIYADNSTLTFSSRWNANISFMEKNINEGLGQVVKWSKMNKMVISQTKTKCMFVVGKRLPKRLDNLNSNLNISLNGARQVKSHTLLRIHLDQDLDFDIQTEVLCKSLSKKIGFLKHKSIFKKDHIKCSMMMLSLNLLLSMVRVCGHLRARQIWTAFSDFKREQQE